MRDKIDELVVLVRDVEQRLRHVEQGRGASIDTIHDRIDKIEQWRRDMETSANAAAKVKEPYARLWWLGVGAVVVMAMTGFAVVMWRIVVAGTAVGR